MTVDLLQRREDLKSDLITLCRKHVTANSLPESDRDVAFMGMTFFIGVAVALKIPLEHITQAFTASLCRVSVEEEEKGK